MNDLRSVNGQADSSNSSFPRQRRSTLKRIEPNHAFRGMKLCVKLAVALVVGISFSSAPLRLAAAEDVPSGTIELSGGSVAAGIGYTWANGVLIFEGKKYFLKVSGLSIVQVGVSSYTSSGTVYNLHKVSDINGIYTAVAAGVAIAGGASAIAMKNSKGVLIQMAATHQGINFSLGAKGLTISVK
jgi:hypothetical protein